MALQFPYTRYLCPCTDINSSSASFDELADASQDNEQGADEQNFDPSSARANYHLYPLENLLFCNECHELRCPRCYYEEASYYFCPSCMFETQSSIVKGETNRCTRSCFQCPICIAPLATTRYSNPNNETRADGDSTAQTDGPFILSCQFCSWSSLEVDIIFDKSNNIYSQLAKIKRGGIIPEPLSEATVMAQKDQSDENEVTDFGSSIRAPKPVDQFSQLAQFYKNQITETNPSGPFGLGHSFGMDSPSHLSRILSTYGVAGLKKQKDQIPLMREAQEKSEGIRVETLEDVSKEDEIIKNMRELGWEGTTSMEQRQNQTNNARFFKDLLPIPVKLRAARSKRCRTCRHNLVKLDDKRQRFKYQIKLLALNFIPKIGMRPLDSSKNLAALMPHHTIQLVLTFYNPLFDTVKVTLATSPTTLGHITSKVTILCPQFEIGANTDVWDDALDTTKHVERAKAREALEGAQAEAGKIWDKGRNWTCVIMEVIPGSLGSSPNLLNTLEAGNSVVKDPQSKDYVLEIPLFVHLEYETDDATGEAATADVQAKTSKDKKVKRDLAYWSVLGVGRIVPLPAPKPTR